MAAAAVVMLRRWIALVVFAGCAAPRVEEPVREERVVAPVQEEPLVDAEEQARIDEVMRHYKPPAGLEERMMAGAADSLEVFSLDPRDMLWLGDPVGTDPARFRNVQVLGSTRVQDAATRQELVREVFHNFRPDKQDQLPFGMGPAYCFEPRHGLRVVDAAGTIDAVICYECGRMIVYSAGEPWEGHILYFGYGREQLQGVLQAAGVQLPPGPVASPLSTRTRVTVRSVEGPRDPDQIRKYAMSYTREAFRRCLEPGDRTSRFKMEFLIAVALTKDGMMTASLSEGLDPASKEGSCVARLLAKPRKGLERAAADAAASVEMRFQR